MLRKLAIHTAYYLLRNFNPALMVLLLKPLELFNKRVTTLTIKNLSECESDSDVEFIWKKTLEVATYNANGELALQLPYKSWLCRLRAVFISHANPFIINQDFTLAYTDAMNLKNTNYNLSYANVKFASLHTAILVSKRTPTVSIEKGVFFLGKASNNYYHLVMEIFTRLYALSFTEAYQDYPLLVDSQTLSIPQFKEALMSVNRTRPVIEIRPENNYLVSDLLIPSDGSRLPINVFNMNEYAATDCMMNPEAILYLKNLLSDTKSSGIAPISRIFIGRKNTLARRSCNEDDLWNVAKKYGFKKVYPENYSFSEQVELFSACDYLIGNTGAAFTNILFLKPGTRILYWLSEKNRQFNSFSSLAKILDIEHTFITGKQADPSDVHSYFEVNAVEFEQSLKQLIS